MEEVLNFLGVILVSGEDEIEYDMRLYEVNRSLKILTCHSTTDNVCTRIYKVKTI